MLKTLKQNNCYTHRLSIYLCLLITLISVSLSNAQTVKLPTEVKGDIGAFITVRAETDGAIVNWYSPDAGLNLFPSDLLSNTKATVVTSAKAGNYRLIAWTAKGDVPSKHAETIVKVGNAPNPPPDPTPDPTPTDPLYTPLAAAYAADTEKDKAEVKGRLADFYSAASSSIKDETFKTWGAWFTARTAVAKSPDVNIFGKLVGVQTVIQGELVKLLPTDGNAAITDAQREIASNQFIRMSKLLKAVKEN